MGIKERVYTVSNGRGCELWTIEALIDRLIVVATRMGLDNPLTYTRYR